MYAVSGELEPSFYYMRTVDLKQMYLLEHFSIDISLINLADITINGMV